MDQATGLESQVRVLRLYCEQNGITNFELFSDGGVSGTKSSRPALDQMMAAVERDEISAVVVHSFSRFARSTTHLLNALTRFKQKGVHFVSISERISAERAAMKREEEELKKKLAAQAETEKQLQETGSVFPDISEENLARE